MSENVKEDMEIITKAGQNYEAEKIASAIRRDAYKKMVEQAVKELEQKGMKGKDLDLLL